MQRSHQNEGNAEDARGVDTRSGHQFSPCSSSSSAVAPTAPTSHAVSADLCVFGNPNSGTPLQDQGSPWDSHPVVVHYMTSFAAFVCIGHLLELPCVQEIGFHIRALSVTVPPPLVPTLQQQLVPHKPYVDMLPWSSLRDRVLNSLKTINEQEFAHDLISGDVRIWGVTPWDPTGWEVGPDFAKKWWFLMDEVIIRTANFWRAQRGEEALVLAV